MGASEPPVIFLMGPTASGKTEVAGRLARRLDCELVSVDAAQVYRGMDIGAAKPDPGAPGYCPHHLIDIRDITDNYSVVDFAEDARDVVADITRRGRVPLLVGGSMFYFSVLENGISELPATDPEVREAVARDLRESGPGALYDELSGADPRAAGRLRPGDTQRVQRAVELLRQTGRPPSSLMTGPRRFLERRRIIKLCVSGADRSVLHRRIERRFRDMVAAGLVDEVRRLAGLVDAPARISALKSVGYRQVIRHLEGELGFEAMIDAGIAATRQLAKRQLTWLRNQSNLVWFDNGSDHPEDAMCAYIESWREQNRGA